MKIRRFEDLEVWQIARDLSVEIYRATQDGKFYKDFGLRDQIRRAAVSVMSNIAEGFDRYSRAEFKQFLSIARGSASEVRSQLHLALALGYISQPQFDHLNGLCWRIARMLGSLRAVVGQEG
jgi:four helix bundle protein